MNHLPDSFKTANTAPVLQILSGSHKGKQFRLLSPRITLGRHSDCDVIFKNNSSCSKYHARIKKEKNSYLIESLDPKTPVLVNKKPVAVSVLKPKDKITIGNVEMLFVEKNLSIPAVANSQAFSKPKRIKQNILTPPRFILALVLIGSVFLMVSKDKKAVKQEKLNVKTESEILKEVEAIQALNKKESDKKALNTQEQAARVAFIEGFRDYRKGYFHRALRMFQHCLTIHKTNPLCRSYVRKARIQIDKLIQKKVRLGNSYKRNKQYEACQAVFKSVEIMVQDSNSAIYKEAIANKKLCETQLKNQI